MRSVRMLLASGAMLALAACASTGTKSNAAPGSSASYDDDIDYQKMAIITEDALSKGYQIVWIHPPQKPKAHD